MSNHLSLLWHPNLIKYANMSCICLITVHSSLLIIMVVGKEENVRSRALTEEHARDSFENLLFSVCRFRELTGRYPSNVTVSSLFHKSYLFWLGELCYVKGEKGVLEAVWSVYS